MGIAGDGMTPLEFLAVFVAMLAIINPLGNIPVFLSLTEGYTPRERQGVILKTVLVGAGVLIAFALGGKYIFDLFGITIPAFRIAGGILIFYVAFDMLKGQKSRTKATPREIQDALERESVGITPLAVPLHSGPGAISTVMLLVTQYPSPMEVGLIFLAVTLVYVLTYVMLYASEFLLKAMGRSGLLVFSRIMGLILAAVAVQFIIAGVTAVVKDMAAVLAAG